MGLQLFDQLSLFVQAIDGRSGLSFPIKQNNIFREESDNFPSPPTVVTRNQLRQSPIFIHFEDFGVVFFSVVKQNIPKWQGSNDIPLGPPSSTRDEQQLPQHLVLAWSKDLRMPSPYDKNIPIGERCHQF